MVLHWFIVLFVFCNTDVIGVVVSLCIMPESFPNLGVLYPVKILAIAYHLSTFMSIPLSRQSLVERLGPNKCYTVVPVTAASPKHKGLKSTPISSVHEYFKGYTWQCISQNNSHSALPSCIGFPCDYVKAAPVIGSRSNPWELNCHVDGSCLGHLNPP